MVEQDPENDNAPQHHVSGSNTATPASAAPQTHALPETPQPPPKLLPIKKPWFRRKRWYLLLLLILIYLWNASWLASKPQGQAQLLAHRGIHQTYDRTNLGRDDCTATRMRPSTNPYLENTIPSMRASFAAGADILELDIHPTTDDDFAVFHDWTIDCRTNGTGVTREQTMAGLRSLDIGYGYTADGGRSFPFRGQGVGLMPSLSDVLTTFPDRQFLINFKSRDPSEADRLIAYLRARHLPTDNRLMVYGHANPVNRLLHLAPQARGFDKARVKACSRNYLIWGWTGYVSDACRNGFIAVPIALRKFAWGWPNRFQQRMSDNRTTIMLVGNLQSTNGVPGIDTIDDLNHIPDDFHGLIWTDAIETTGPAWQARRNRR